jgi:hypothetical protein
MKPGTRILNMPRAAAAVAALTLAIPSAHAAPTVWNVNIGNQVTTSDNFAGAAVENTMPNSFWNSVTTTPTGFALKDSTEATTTATLTMSAGAGLGFGNQTLNSGPEIFNSWTNGNSNSVFTMTLEGLDSSGTYDLIVYSDWWWNNGDNFPVTQTVGTGLTGTVYLNHIKSGTNGTVPGLVQDIGLVANDGSQGNWIRITGLTPDASGILAFNMGGQNAALNGFQLIKPDTGDTTPPTPNPSTWDTQPVATSQTSITMTATAAADPNGVEYLFTETTDKPGATSSVWQDSPTYTDTGLTPGDTYTYTVTARDKSPAQNVTTESTAESATTDSVDTAAPTPDPMSFDVMPVAASIFQITMTAATASDVNGVEYYFTETSGNMGGSDSGWQESPVYTDGGLTPGTSYTYTVKARDKSLANNETAASAPASASTNPETAVASVWNVSMGDLITTSDNFAGAAVENTTPNSFWNSITNPNTPNQPLSDMTGAATPATVTFASSNSMDIPTFATLSSGIELFSRWLTSGNAPINMTIGGLSASRSYDLIVYSDWFWNDGAPYPVTQTAGTGLTGTFRLDHITTDPLGQVPALVQDTDSAENPAIQGNWIRISGLTPDENGNLAFSIGGANSALNGFQLVQTSSLLARINSFGIPGADGVINHAAKSISLTVPFGTDLATLAPDFTLAPGSTCNQTSGAPPSPTFAVSSTVNYVVTDTSTDPDTVNSYAVTVTVGPEIGILVIDLGNSPGTTIAAGGVIGSGPINLPIPSLPPGSILRSIAVNITLQATDNDNYANDLSVLFGPSQGAYTLGLVPSVASVNFSPAETLNWGAGLGEGGVGTSLVTTRTDADWLANIDLGAVGLFLGNAFDSGTPGVGGTWSGTITLTYDIPSGSAYATWATGNQPFDGDANGDGVTDGMAFLLGAATPAENAIGRLPTAENNGGLVLRFSSRDAASRGTSALKVQWSYDLGATDFWSSNEATLPPAPGGTVNGVVFVITENPIDPTIDEVQATIPSGQASGGKLFARLLGIEN